jgi:hypothetical protein
MKRTLIVTLLLVLACGSVVAQKKIKIACPANLKTIRGCPLTGCGGAVDPNLNKKKNVGFQSGSAKAMTIEELQALADPVPGLKIGGTREKAEALGEGDLISVVAFALIARKGGKESCNCGLKEPKDTDNHIVLVDEPTLKLTARATRAKPPAPGKKKGTPARTAKQNTLTKREKESSTAEFTPRVRLTHEKLAGAQLQALIAAAPKSALLVRVTGLQFFDSEHSLGPFHLPRVNNWEIHPVMKLEFCPTGKTCTKDSDENWEDLADQP